jgi:hypothetical protein
LRIEGTGDDYVDIPNIDDPVRFRRAIETAKHARNRAELTDSAAE